MLCSGSCWSWRLCACPHTYAMAVFGNCYRVTREWLLSLGPGLPESNYRIRPMCSEYCNLSHYDIITTSCRGRRRPKALDFLTCSKCNGAVTAYWVEEELEAGGGVSAFTAICSLMCVTCPLPYHRTSLLWISRCMFDSFWSRLTLWPMKVLVFLNFNIYLALS